MLDRVFDNYVMGSMQRWSSAHYITRQAGAGCATPDEAEIAGGKEASPGLWLARKLARRQCAAAARFACHVRRRAVLFYADWVERIPDDCPRLASLRAELLALPAVSRCVEDARPYRAFFPLGAPDRD